MSSRNRSRWFRGWPFDLWQLKVFWPALNTCALDYAMSVLSTRMCSSTCSTSRMNSSVRRRFVVIIFVLHFRTSTTSSGWGMDSKNTTDYLPCWKRCFRSRQMWMKPPAAGYTSTHASVWLFANLPLELKLLLELARIQEEEICNQLSQAGQCLKKMDVTQGMILGWNTRTRSALDPFSVLHGNETLFKAFAFGGCKVNFPTVHHWLIFYAPPRFTADCLHIWNRPKKYMGKSLHEHVHSLRPRFYDASSSARSAESSLDRVAKGFWEPWIAWKVGQIGSSHKLD